MHPAWKKRSLYCERYRQRTKTCNVQVSCNRSGITRAGARCNFMRKVSPWFHLRNERPRPVPPHRRGFDFLLRLRKLRFESEKRLALHGRTMRGRREQKKKRKKRARSIYYTGCLNILFSCQAMVIPGSEFNFFHEKLMEKFYMYIALGNFFFFFS